jgi:hypothetical protein
MPKRKALVAASRKQCHIIWSVWHNNKSIEDFKRERAFALTVQQLIGVKVTKSVKQNSQYIGREITINEKTVVQEHKKRIMIRRSLNLHLT